MKECPVCSRCFPDHVNHCPGDGDALRHTIMGDIVLDGRYQLEKRLGQGGMGVVFKARHIFLKTQHAVKIILPDLVGNDPSLVTRFRQEAMAAAAIRHPNTISVTDFGVVSGTTPFLVMEFIEGRSLHELLLERGRLDPVQALEVMIAVAAGVGAAHKQGIIHRDLKPLNIILRDGVTAGEGVKVLDFGLAKIKSGELLGSFVAAQTQGMMGSPFYMAPEQWSDEDIDLRADIYSLGIILYQMLAGEVPFKGNSIPAIMKKHLTEAPAPLSTRGVQVPPAVEAAMHHALEKDADMRPQSVEEFLDELRAALAATAAERVQSSPDAGMMTVSISPSDTRQFNRQAEAETRDLQDAASGPARGGQTQTDGHALPTGAIAPAEPNGATVQGQTAADAFSDARTRRAEEFALPPETGDDTASETIFEAREAAPSLNATVASNAADTAALHRQAEEAQEQARRRAEEEEARLIAAAEQQRREQQAREQREAEERADALRRQEEERAAARNASAVEQDEEQTMLAAQPVADARGAVRAAQPERSAGRTHATASDVSAQTSVGAGPARPRMTLLIACALVALVGIVGGLYLWSTRTAPATNANAGSNARGAGVNPTPASEAPKPALPEMVAVAGGTFRMGRDDAPPESASVPYRLWVYSQWPAHFVTVQPFELGKTEVTSADYAEFVRETGHPPPPEVWDGNKPRAGEELWPVRNVTYQDAQAFAAWRSKRDGVAYRLPSEEEWEFAAVMGYAKKSGDAQQWQKANLNNTAPAPVGSFMEGQTSDGLQDMMGNVWEWTSSEAAMYPGNTRTQLRPEDRGKLVVRGGSYQSKLDGDEPITVAARKWVAKDARSPVLGFRLARSVQQ